MAKGIGAQVLTDFIYGSEAERAMRDTARENIANANVDRARLTKQLASTTDDQERKDILAQLDGVNATIAGNSATASKPLGVAGSLLNNVQSAPAALQTAANTFTGSLAQGINNFFRSKENWQSPNNASTHLREQANKHDLQSADLQKAAQQSAQIANRDYHVDADKNAAAGAATENAQRLQNMSASAGAGAAALNRQVKSSDYNTMMARQDAQRDKAVERNKESWDVQQQAERERAAADNSDYMAYQVAKDNSESEQLSRAAGMQYNTAAQENAAPYFYTTDKKPKPEPKPVPKPVPKSEPKSEPKPASKPEPKSEDRPVIPQGTESENNPNGTHNVYWDTRRNQYVVYTDEDAKNVHAGRLKLTKRCNTRAEADEECRRLNGQHNVDYSRTGGNNMPDNVGVGDNFAAATNSDYYKQYGKAPSDAICKNIIKGLYRRY